MQNLQNKGTPGKNGPHPVLLLLPALFIFWGFGVETLGARLTTEVNGTITAVQYLPKKGAARYAAEYTLQGADGKSSAYIAGPTDASLPRDMPVGTTLQKTRWQLGYERDGKPANDFPIAFYSAAFGIALGFILWSFLQWRLLRKTRKQPPTLS